MTLPHPTLVSSIHPAPPQLTLKGVLSQAQLPNDVLRQVRLDALALSGLALSSLQQVVKLLRVKLLGVQRAGQPRLGPTSEPLHMLCPLSGAFNSGSNFSLESQLLAPPPESPSQPGSTLCSSPSPVRWNCVLYLKDLVSALPGPCIRLCRLTRHSRSLAGREMMISSFRTSWTMKLTSSLSERSWAWQEVDRMSPIGPWPCPVPPGDPQLQALTPTSCSSLSSFSCISRK